MERYKLKKGGHESQDFCIYMKEKKKKKTC